MATLRIFMLKYNYMNRLMMDTNSPFNLFSKSASGKRNKSKEEKKPLVSQPAIPKKTTNSTPPPARVAPPSDVEVDDLLKKMQVMAGDLNDRVNTIVEKSGKSLKQVKTYCENPQNFSKEEWNLLQFVKMNIQERISTVLGNEYKDHIQHAEVTKQQKDRTAKTLGSRKKNWISMR